MLQERSLLKLTEHSELNTKITLKTWSFQARRQDSVIGGGGRNKFGGGTGSLFTLIREGHGDTRNLFQCGSNEQSEDQKKRSSVQQFPQILVIVSKFAIFHEFLSVEQKKRGLRPKSFIKSGVSPQKLRKYGR